MSSPTSDHDTRSKGAPANHFGASHQRLVLALCCALGFALRLAAAAHHSPWLDEFHTLFHARRDGLVALFESLSRDNHPPLSFAFVQIARNLGEDFLVLRVPSLLAGTLTIALVVRLTWRLAGPSAALVAGCFVALSTQHLLSSSEARMYAWLGLGLIGLADACSQGERTGRLPWSASLWLAVALLSHYFALHHLAVAVVGLVIWRPAHAAAVQLACSRRTWLVMALGVALAVPWYAAVFPEQLTHGLWSGGGRATWRGFIESYPSLVARRVSLAPAPLAAAVIAAVALLFALALHGLSRLRSRAPLVGALLAAQAFLLPIWSAVVSHLVARSGFDPKYLAAGGLALVVLSAVGAVALLRGRKLVLLTAAIGLPLLALDLIVIADPGSEDYRGATQRALQLVGPRVPLAPIEWQPDLFDRAQGFIYELDQEAPRERNFDVLIHDESYDLGAALAGRELDGLVVLVRGLPEGDLLWSRLTERFGTPTVERFGVVRAVLYGSAATSSR